jgi:hypothetical protein
LTKTRAVRGSETLLSDGICEDLIVFVEIVFVKIVLVTTDLDPVLCPAGLHRQSRHQAADPAHQLGAGVQLLDRTVQCSAVQCSAVQCSGLDTPTAKHRKINVKIRCAWRLVIPAAALPGLSCRRPGPSRAAGASPGYRRWGAGGAIQADQEDKEDRREEEENRRKEDEETTRKEDKETRRKEDKDSKPS